MSSLLIRPEKNSHQHCITHITPESAGWKYVGFEVYELRAGEHIDFSGSDQEVCLVLVAGKCSVITEESTPMDIGERMSPFEKIPPHAVHLPMATDYRVLATTDLELAVCKAPGKSKVRKARHLKPEDITVMDRGEGTNQRLIHNILMPEHDADSLLITEVYTPGGHWSSYPPHKHDTDDIPRESYLEETYYHRLNPPQGFAFQRVYTDERDIDETMCVQDKDTVLVPRGYHPVAAPHGYELYYLNVMAGPTRAWKFHNDPDHEWILE